MNEDKQTTQRTICVFVFFKNQMTLCIPFFVSVLIPVTNRSHGKVVKIVLYQLETA